MPKFLQKAHFKIQRHLHQTTFKNLKILATQHVLKLPIYAKM